VEYLKNQQNEASSGFASAASTPDRGSKSHASVPSAVQDDQISRAEACDQGDKMEQDSDEAEEANYEALLLPGGCFPTSVSRFAVGVNYELLHGWVKQPSPCCAAASLAGAINALRGLKRQEKGAWGHRDVLYIMADILAAQADKLRESAERCLGAELTPLLNPLHQTLEKLELSLDKKDCTKKLILRVIRDITSEACEGHKQDPPAACFRLLRELMEAEHAKLDGEEECTAKNDESEEEGAEEEKNEDDHPQQTTDGGEGDEFPRKAVAMTFDFSSTDSVKKKAKGKKTLRGIKAERQWEWGDALYKWLHKLGQVRKLTRDLPSTGPIGSWGILAAVERIDELGLARGVPRSGADADEGVRENAEVVRDDVGRAAIAGYKVRVHKTQNALRDRCVRAQRAEARCEANGGNASADARKRLCHDARG